MTTYPEMNAKIINLLRLSDCPVKLYAAARIEELEAMVNLLSQAVTAQSEALLNTKE